MKPTASTVQTARCGFVSVLLLGLFNVGCSESGRVRITESPGEAATQTSEQESVRRREAVIEAVREASRLVEQALSHTNQATNQGPIDIFAVLTEAGFEPHETTDYANHLPIPPGATGQIGRFQLESDTVVVARITYQNENFAAPHLVLARERATSLSERVIVDGASIIQVHGTSDEATNIAAEVLEQKVSRRSQND